MTQTDSLSRKIALIALAVIGYGCQPDELDSEHLFLKDRRQLQQLEPLIASELAEREKKVAELVTAAENIRLAFEGKDQLPYIKGLGRLRAALSGLGVK